jgi:DNA-binding transcriptional LysR family regulator
MSLFPVQMATHRQPEALEWSDLSVVLAICRAGSLSGAARTLSVNHSTIFRRINAIEEKTGVRFFERLPEGYAMTDAGRTAMRYAERIEAEVHALGREVLGQDMRLEGKITVTAMEGLAAQMGPRLMAGFCRRHPDVAIEMVGSVAALDLGRRQADIAIRATRKPPDTSLGKKICDFRFAVFSSPQYLEGKADVPLADHDWSFISGSMDWLVPLVWKKKAQGEARTIFSSSLSMAVLNAAAEGMGVTLMPCYLGDSDKRLVRASETIEPLTLELWLLTHPDLRHTARVKALMAYLYDALKQESDLFEGKTGSPD